MTLVFSSSQYKYNVVKLDFYLQIYVIRQADPVPLLPNTQGSK